MSNTRALLGTLVFAFPIILNVHLDLGFFLGMGLAIAGGICAAAIWSGSIKDQE